MSVRVELKEYMSVQNVSQNQVAKAIGMSTGAISAWMNESYTGDVGKIEANVRNFLDRSKEKGRIGRFDMKFCETSVALDVFKAARMAHLEQEIVVCTGDAGLGKTLAVKEYAARDNSVILIEADPDFSPWSLLTDLHRRLGLGTQYKGLNDMFNLIVDRLADSGRLIIVDEAEYLQYKALERLRRLHDKAGVGVLLIGMPRLIENLRGRHNQYAQLYSRAGSHMRLASLTDVDCKMILHANLANASDRTGAAADAFFLASRKNTRVLGKLVKRSIRVSKHAGRPIDEAIIKQTAEMLIV